MTTISAYVDVASATVGSGSPNLTANGVNLASYGLRAGDKVYKTDGTPVGFISVVGAFSGGNTPITLLANSSVALSAVPIRIERVPDTDRVLDAQINYYNALINNIITSLGTLTGTANTVPGFDNSNNPSMFSVSVFARTLLDDTSLNSYLTTMFAKGADIASATTTDIGAATGFYVNVTGTTTITGLGTVAAGVVRLIRFTGALTLTHNSTSLVLPGSANITTVAGDFAMFVSEGSGNWRCAHYQAALPSTLNFRNRLAKTANYTVATADDGVVFALGGNAYFTLTYSAASGYNSGHRNVIVNEDGWTSPGRAKWITLNGYGSFYLWPTESIIVFAENNTWRVIGRHRTVMPPGTVNFYTDYTNGNDTTGATDGLASGSGAFKTLQTAFSITYDQLAWTGPGQTNCRFNMAAFTQDLQLVHLPPRSDPPGAQGGASIEVWGASKAITGAANNGSGLIRLTMASTTGYTTNDKAVVYGVAGTTEANGFWKVTVINGTHLDLQASTFTNAYTSGGTITAGSELNVNGGPAFASYFGSTISLNNFGMSATSSVLVSTWGSRIYFNDGMYFNDRQTGGACFAASNHGQIEIGGQIGVCGTYSYVTFITDHGSFRTGGSARISFLAGTNPTLTVFAYSLTFGLANFSNITLDLGGNTFTGKRAQADYIGQVVSYGGVPNTYFPGTVNFTTSGGGQVL